jgi:hypothetical protein
VIGFRGEFALLIFHPGEGCGFCLLLSSEFRAEFRTREALLRRETPELTLKGSVWIDVGHSLIDPLCEIGVRSLPSGIRLQLLFLANHFGQFPLCLTQGARSTLARRNVAGDPAKFIAADFLFSDGFEKLPGSQSRFRLLCPRLELLELPRA